MFDSVPSWAQFIRQALRLTIIHVGVLWHLNYNCSEAIKGSFVNQSDFEFGTTCKIHIICIVRMCLSVSECKTELLEKTNFPGDDIMTVSSLDAKRCQLACTQHQTCRFFAFNTRYVPTCWKLMFETFFFLVEWEWPHIIVNHQNDSENVLSL